MCKVAVLIDITSIQKYVFGSSKLKENLGASHLISTLYDSTILKNDDLKDIPIKKDGEPEGYIGGGNALFFFEDEIKAKRFVEDWTRYLLTYAPGIIVTTAINEWDDFKVSRDALFDKLRENKYMHIPQIIPQRHGISAECNSDGLSMDVWRESEKEYVSASTNAKIDAFEKARKIIAKEFEDILGDKFCFTGELDKLGQDKGSENHIAIVHIDGNSMGDRFKALSSIEAIKMLSDELENAVKKAFYKLLELIKSELDDSNKKEFLSLKKENEKEVFPIRPIILGGDDITFVCDGRMGIYYAKYFMAEFAKQSVSFGGALSSCAGIAVIKTKYPFYKGYQLAEELCANAKSRRKEFDDNGSWFDFHIAYGGFSGSLKEIRKQHYEVGLNNLLYRPYKILDSSEYSFETFVDNSKHLKNLWPNNKIKELREVLTLGDVAIKIFINEITARDLTLKDIGAKDYNKKLFVNDVTPYFDMIELLEYYPKYELEEVKNEKN